ncbi:TPA: hypothetical protein EYP70_02050 [Candidatus Bathyarchaeota archaeon]|nr:hypothetical protein [Candidatus Bathyarchaeota archaeon]
MIEVLELFKRETGVELLIPKTVYLELTQEGVDIRVQAGLRGCIENEIIKVIEENEEILQKINHMNPGLGDGELGGISLAPESKGNEVTLIDDKKARKQRFLMA